MWFSVLLRWMATRTRVARFRQLRASVTQMEQLQYLLLSRDAPWRGQREQCKLLFNLPLVLPVDSYPTPCPGLHTRRVLALFSYSYSSLLTVVSLVSSVGCSILHPTQRFPIPSNPSIRQLIAYYWHHKLLLENKFKLLYA